jgi:N-hydroxyarylamine O-acetyltransferase
MPDQLDLYLDRIGHPRPVKADIGVLRSLFAAHIRAVPFENIDVQLQRPLSRDGDAIFDKLVTRRRGGWCYEQNGLLSWALAELGFEITPFAGGVMRKVTGDFALGNHLGLIVHLDEDWLVDVGFGGSLSSPIRLEECAHRQAPYTISLNKIDDGYWRFEEDGGSGPFSFDFKPVAADQALLDSKLQWLRTDAQSPFVQNLVVQQRQDEVHLSLRGRVLTRLSADGRQQEIFDDPDRLVACLHDVFGLDVPEIAACWPDICARHDALFGPAEPA